MNDLGTGRFGSLDDEWESVEPASSAVLPNGRYVARLVRVIPYDRLGSAPKVALVFEVVGGRFKGCESRHFLSFGNVARAKGTLSLLGLQDVRPSDLLSFAGFARLPAVFVTTLRVVSRDRIFSNVALIEPAPTRLNGGDELPPDPAGEAA